MIEKFFKKKKTENPGPLPVASLKPIDYPALVILAWAKAVEGNEEIQSWLKDNGYPELFFSVHAIYLKDEPRDWLLKNGYAHLLAMIHLAEGKHQAGKWLLQNNYETLYHIGRAVDHENESWLWLRKFSTQDIFMLAKSIQFIKDQIEENHNDMHAINKDL